MTLDQIFSLPSELHCWDSLSVLCPTGQSVSYLLSTRMIHSFLKKKTKKTLVHHLEVVQHSQIKTVKLLMGIQTKQKEEKKLEVS